MEEFTFSYSDSIALNYCSLHSNQIVGIDQYTVNILQYSKVRSGLKVLALFCGSGIIMVIMGSLENGILASLYAQV